MTKLNFGSECVVCSKPFTNFRWCPGKGMRFKTTQICQTCAKIKHCCQTCLFDLDYGLPTQVRDSILNIKQDMPKSEVNRQYFSQNMERSMDSNERFIDTSKVDASKHEILKKLVRKEVNYNRNRAHVCSFFIKGECKRGEACPYRHSLPEPHELVRNGRNAIRDRYYGENDELAEKMLHRVKHGETKAPEDTSVTSIIIRGVSDRLTESDVRDYFYAFGEISSVVLIAKKEIGYVNYVLRESAERAIERSYGDVVIKGCQLQVAWSKSKSESGRKAENSMATTSSSGHGSDGKGGAKSKMPPPPPGSSKISYDAQDPYQLGSRN